MKLLTLGGRFAEALAFEREPVGIVHEPIEDGVGNGGVADDLVPTGRRTDARTAPADVSAFRRTAPKLA